MLSPYPTTAEWVRVAALWFWCVLVLIFLVVPIFVPVPLSFNSGSFFTFPLAGLSTRWYEVVLGTPRWRAAIGNSLLIGLGATVLATVLGTLTAIGLSDPKFPARRFVVPMLISPLIMLNYQSLSFHDILYVRQTLGRRCAPEFEDWLQRMELADAPGNLPEQAVEAIGPTMALIESIESR